MFEAGSCQMPLHWLVRSQLRTRSELVPKMFGASSELASVMEFGFLAAKYHIEPHDVVRSSVARIKDGFWFCFSELV